MALTNQRSRTVNLSALILRVAVAGILTISGVGKFTGYQPPLDAKTPPLAESKQVAVDAPEAAQGTLETVEGVASAVLSNADTSAEAGMYVGKSQLIGAAELGFALVLFVGLLTRLAALAGVVVTAGSALVSHGMVQCADLPSCANPLIGLYESNPPATLLLGAVCLSLLVSGCGSLGMDRALFGRKTQKQHEAVEPA